MGAVDASTSLPPGAVGDALVERVRSLAEEHFPTVWADVVQRTTADRLAVQAVSDLELDRCAHAPFLLAGDAGTLTRPHTASGAVKALQDALCLEGALREADDLRSALNSYGSDRCAEGNRLVRLGRRIGRDQVQATPLWADMSPARMAEWTRRTLRGDAHYLYGNTPRSTP